MTVGHSDAEAENPPIIAQRATLSGCGPLSPHTLTGMTNADVSGDQAIELWQTVTEGFSQVNAKITGGLGELGIPDLWCSALVHLLRTDDHRLPMSKLAQQLSVTSGGFTKMADRMAREGLIDRRNVSVDRRVVHAALTSKGEELARRAAALYAEGIRTFVFEPLGREGLQRLVQLMTVVHNDGEDGVPEPHEPGFITTERDGEAADRRTI